MVTNATPRVWSDLAVPPGELLQEELDAIGMTQQEFAMRTGRPAQVINEIIRDKKRITHETALEFEKVLGIPAYFWVNLEADYQLTQARLRDQEELRRQEEWLKEFPVREMEKREWISRHTEKIDKVRELLRFLGAASFPAWRHTMETVLGYRITPHANVSEGALAAWLRKGELEGRERHTCLRRNATPTGAVCCAHIDHGGTGCLRAEGARLVCGGRSGSCVHPGVATFWRPRSSAMAYAGEGAHPTEPSAKDQ